MPCDTVIEGRWSCQTMWARHGTCRLLGPRPIGPGDSADADQTVVLFLAPMHPTLQVFATNPFQHLGFGLRDKRDGVQGCLMSLHSLSCRSVHHSLRFSRHMFMVES